jgi:hypothetical protein
VKVEGMGEGVFGRGRKPIDRTAAGPGFTGKVGSKWSLTGQQRFLTGETRRNRPAKQASQPSTTPFTMAASCLSLEALAFPT